MSDEREPWYERKVWWTSYKAYAAFLMALALGAIWAHDAYAMCGWTVAAMLALKLSRWQRMP